MEEALFVLWKVIVISLLINLLGLNDCDHDDHIIERRSSNATTQLSVFALAVVISTFIYK